MIIIIIITKQAEECIGESKYTVRVSTLERVSTAIVLLRLLCEAEGVSKSASSGCSVIHFLPLSIAMGPGCSREHKLQKEHDIAVNKLNEWRRRMESQLQEALQKLKDFASKQSMSEADKYLAELGAIADKIEWFKEEV